MCRILAIGLGLILAGGVHAQELSAEQKVIGQWVGTWKTEVVNKRAEWNPNEVTATGTITCKWILGGKFVEESGSSLGPGVEHRLVLGYDPQRKAYRDWFFNSQGDTIEGEGTWDAKTSTMTWKSEAGPGLTGTATHHFFNADSYEWTYVVKDGAGKVYFDVRGKHTRVK
jgi:hypothetical protein